MKICALKERLEEKEEGGKEGATLGTYNKGACPTMRT